MRKQGEPVKIIEHRADGTTCEIGSWRLAGERNNNWDDQADIGWHIMLALQRGATKVEVVIGNTW